MADLKQKAFHERISDSNLAALWVGREGIDLSKPKSPAQAVLWPFNLVRPNLMEAGNLVTAEEAFRRVLVLENPAFSGEMRATNTLYAGLQLVLPGEIAPCHRHSQTALRFVIEGRGAYTTVDGERAWLEPGDFVITPGWGWHDHGNPGNEPVIWLDILDTPLVDLLDTVFRENYPKTQQPIVKPDEDSAARYGSGMLPLSYCLKNSSSPAFKYPYNRALAALKAAGRAEHWDSCQGLKLEYINPATGGPVTPSMSASLQLLPANFKGDEYRSTDSVVFCVAEGEGSTFVQDQRIDWKAKDVFVVPGWKKHRHQNIGSAVLFSVSDRPVHQKLELWREERFDDQISG